MTTDDPASRGFSLKRWSQRKLEHARAPSAPSREPAPPANPAPQAPVPPPATPSVTAAETSAPPALPPIESLTIDSDFSVFLGAEVDPALRREALKKLFRDPRFNVMDGLDVYIDDYSIAETLPPEVARGLAHARYLFDPPRTRVNEAGFVEDIPADEGASDVTAPPSEPMPVAPPAAAASEATRPAITARAVPQPSIATRDSDADSANGEANTREGREPARR